MKTKFYQYICLFAACILFCGMYLDTNEIKQGIIDEVFSSLTSEDEYISDDLEPYSDYQNTDCKKRFDDLTSSKIDVRYCDISSVNFENLPKDIINKMSFNDKTIWPAQMPTWFDLDKINKIGKTPGLNVRELHKQGITGKGVGIAIIDQPLSSHQEYRSNLRHYKNFARYKKGTMHGTAVASIAVGKNIGVAPDANLYFVVAEFREDYNEILDAGPVADAINYILELNETLPLKNKISIISISRGFSEYDSGRKEFQAALQNAEKQNILVLTTNDIYTVSKDGYLVDSDDLSSYTMSALNDENIVSLSRNKKILVPTGYRITACETGEQDYAYYSQGNLGWGVPYLAGVAALAKQVKPNLDMKDFFWFARKTADKITVKDSKGKQYTVKYFINPKRLINSL